MWNAVDGQLTAERRTRTMRLVGRKNTSQIEARRFRPLLGWELSGIRQRLPQGAFYWGYLLFSETFFASRSFNRLMAWTSAARSNDELPAPKSKQSGQTVGCRSLVQLTFVRNAVPLRKT